MSKRIDPPGTRRGMRLYRIWCNMKSRCYNENIPNFKNYGGRGIAVCNEWRNDFTSFLNWSLENGYKNDLLIDRIDNNGNYEPTNCRWTTRKQQNLNRRNNRLVTIDGVTRSFSEWADDFGISRSTALCRVQAGKTEQEALITPVIKN
ncbi:hypothetical protein JC777_00225 (plasmid) [Bacillus cytotoxicus]|uniref:A0A061P417 (Uncharacterized protein) n=3 Tax=Bacillus TaxID=1386 RepID=A0AAX2CNV4_9BACI|nr:MULTISPECIES: hypothetical protein [Bacillus cereus group]QTR81147.1 hypothetical protein JC777_00225 [Bacillus cytotoxicus]SCM08460.1 A0A061P417 (Uncharacterized protein) [Bacillus cytotoxicus]HDR4589362.1 hypothetical protein [Bacillus cytotoxicus]